MKRKLKYGMIGGGPGAFIGAVHRIAAALDNTAELVCGAFSSNAEKSKAMSSELFIDPTRCYSSWQEMIIEEQKLPEGERMDFVSIVTPNHVHYQPAKMAMEYGLKTLLYAAL